MLFWSNAILLARNPQAERFQTILGSPNANAVPGDVRSVYQNVCVIHRAFTSFFRRFLLNSPPQYDTFLVWCRNASRLYVGGELCANTVFKRQITYGWSAFYMSILNLRLRRTSNMSCRSSKSSSVASTGIINRATFPDANGIDCEI